MNYKLKLVIACAIFSASNLDAQQVQTGVATGTFAASVPNTTKPWLRGGNLPVAGGGADNVFGTMWNSPIYTKTNTAFREKLNGDFTALTQYPINGYTGFSPIPVNTSGYLLLGPNTPSQLGGNIYDVNRGAFSLLHLNGIQNSITGGGFAQELGYRPWMKTGITYTGNNDLMYMGVRALAPGQDQTEMVISWADNAFPTAGPDDFAFRFMGTGASNVISTNLSDENDLDGRHIARFAPTGEMGLGNTFGPPGAPYVRPQNLLHLSLDLQKQVFMQITNQLGTGQTVNDGLLVGYAPTSATNLEARINQQENDRLSLYANNGERIRIMQIGALNNGVPFNPGALPTNLTRVGVSHDPTQPVTRPLSLMHLGYNTGATNDGWRNWMDVGTFTANGTDNMYVGLKREPTSFPIDRFDAVINWGDNSGPVGPFAIGPDNLRFIFTSATVGTPGLPPSNGVNGVEGMRMTPSTNVAVTNAHVWTGIGGDPTVNLYGPGGTSINPTQTLEVNSSEATTVVGGSSGLRFTNLNTTSPTTLTNPGPGVLAVDVDGDVIYVPATVGTGVGNYCAPTPGTNPLLGDYEIPLAAFNYRFTGQSVPFDPASVTPNTNTVGLGYICGNPMPAKFSVLQFASPSVTVNLNTVAGSFINSDVTSSAPARIYRGVVGVTNGVQPINIPHTNIGGDFRAQDAFFSFGVRGIADYATQADKVAYGGAFYARGINNQNIGVYGEANNSAGSNSAVQGVAQGTGTNYGGNFIASGGTLNYAVFGAAATTGTPGAGTPTGPNYAGYFNGDVYIAGTYGPSDINLKDSIVDITNAMDIINQLNAKTFEFKHSSYPSMNLPQGLQYGLIAQEVETVLPALITNNVQPEVLDSLGVVVTPAVSFKGLEYQQLIPILLEGIKEQQSKIDSLNDENDMQDSINTSLQNQINQLASLINSCCSSHSMQQNNNSNNLNAQQDVNLKDGQTIILDQNTPNPFSEQTTINYFLPDNVVKAQMLFYNVSGKLIQSVDLNEKGKGSLNVFAQDLSNGIYTYTLVVDGKIIESKKMVKQ